MASPAEKRFTGENVVYGNLAYDLGSPAIEFEYYAPPAGEVLEEPAVDAPVVEEKAAASAAALNRQAIAPFALIGFACAAMLLVFSLMARIQLTSISDETVALQSELTELETEQQKLLIEYESAFNLAEIEEYAMNELGMQKPRDDQIYYIDGTAPDKAVAAENGEGTGFLDRIGAFFASLGEYFR